MSNAGGFCVLTGSGPLAWSVGLTQEFYAARGQITFYLTVTTLAAIFPAVKWESPVYLQGFAKP